MLLVVSETSSVMIYENTTLRWSAKLSLNEPVAVRRGEVKLIRGALAFLTETGNLQICYLGTEPQLFTAPPLLNKDLEFDQVEEELIRLNRIIRNSRNNGG